METDLPQGWKTNLRQEGEVGDEGGEDEVEEEGEEVEIKEVMIHPPGRMRLNYQPTAVAAPANDLKFLMVPTIAITIDSQANVMFVSTWRRKEMSCQHTLKFLIQ